MLTGFLPMENYRTLTGVARCVAGVEALLTHAHPAGTRGVAHTLGAARAVPSNTDSFKQTRTVTRSAR